MAVSLNGGDGASAGGGVAGGGSPQDMQRTSQKIVEDWLPAGLGEDFESEENVETLEDLLCRRQLALTQLRADLEARQRRSAEMEAKLKTFQEQEATLQEKLKSTKDALSTVGTRADAALVEERAREASLRGREREQGRELEALEEQVAEMQSKLDSADQDRTKDDSALKVLWTRRRQVEALRETAETCERSSNELRRDSRRLLDLLARIHIDAAGGPSPSLAGDDVMPPEVRSRLKVSADGEYEMIDVVNKYLDAMSNPSDRSSSSTAIPSQLRLHRGSGGGLEKASPSSAPPNFATSTLSLPEAQRSAQLEEESELLRSALLEEMREVSAVLTEPGGSPEREVLRAAAWADIDTLQEWLPLADVGEGPGEAELLGWSAWHAASAHGQADVLRFLDQYFVRCGRARVAEMGLSRPSGGALGLSPLAIACLQGHVEVAKTLLKLGSPVNEKDNRGNSFLHYARSSKRPELREALTTLLLDNGCNPNALNGSGQAALALPGTAEAPSTQLSLGGSRPPMHHAPPSLRAGAASRSSSAGSSDASDEDARPSLAGRGASRRPSAGSAFSSQLPSMRPRRKCHELRSLAAMRRERQSFLSRTVASLTPPVRDSTGFLRSETAVLQVALDQQEEDLGVWSADVENYTHAGLDNLFSHEETDWPSYRPGAAQRLVLTSQRLFLFDADWILQHSFPLADIDEIVVPERSDGVLKLSLRNKQDMLLDMTSRDRFLEELQIAFRCQSRPARGSLGASASSSSFSSSSKGDIVERWPVRYTLARLIMLQDATGLSVAVAAWPAAAEEGGMLLIPFDPGSLLLKGLPTATATAAAPATSEPSQSLAAAAPPSSSLSLGLGLSLSRGAGRGGAAAVSAASAAAAGSGALGRALPPETFFGYMELRRRSQPKKAGAGVCWRWHRYFFILLGGSSVGVPRLIWCAHPTADRAVGTLPLANIRQAKPAEPSSQSDPRLVLEYVQEDADSPSNGRGSLSRLPLTLKAPSVEGREEWLAALKARVPVLF